MTHLMRWYPTHLFLSVFLYHIESLCVKPHSPFLKAVIDEVRFRIHDYTPMKYHVGRKGVLNTTGPVPYSIAIEKVIQSQQHSYRYERFASEFGLIYINADTTVVNKNHYRLQINPVVKLNTFNYILYKLWLYVLHPRKALGHKNHK